MPQMANRVQETTTTGGTGTITLGGAVTGYLTFASSFATSSVLFYTIDNGVGEWEIGIGTLVTTGTLSRTTVIASSNGGALVNFGSGTKRVFCSAPTRSLVPDQDSKSGYVLTTDGTNPSWTQTLNGITIGNTTPAAGAFTTLSASSTVSGTGFSTYLASPPAIGGTTPAAGSFTTLGATGNVTLGDASGDTLTINGTAVSIPNNLNFDSDTLFIDAANNRVGIGTSSPGAKLEVSGGASSAVLRLSTTNNQGSGAPAYNFGELQYWTTDEEAPQVIAYVNAVADTASTYPGSILAFGTSFYGDGTAKVKERMRLDSSGNLGLGVTPTAPDAGKAYEVGFNGNGLWSRYQNEMYLSNNAKRDGATWKYAGNDRASSFMQFSGQHVWYTAPSGTAGSAISFGTPKMILDASGNLGVGLTSPYGGTRISVKQQNADRYGIVSFASSNDAFLQLGHTGTVGAVASTYNATAGFTPLAFFTGDIERMRIDNGGNFIHQVNGSAPTLSTNNTMSFELTSNTSLKIVVRGTDGVTRSVSLTLA